MLDLEQRIEAIATGIADEVTSYLTESIVPLIDELVAERLAAIVAQLGGTGGTKPTPARSPARRVPKATRATSSTKATTKTTGPKCGKCGRTGHNARTCGKAPASDDEDEEEAGAIDQPIRSPAATTERTARTARIRRNAPSTKPPEHQPEPDDEDDEPEDKKPWQPAPAIARGPACAHGNGSPARCSQCVLGAAAVKRVAIAGGNIVVDGAIVRSTREQELGANASLHGGPRHGKGRRRLVCARCGQPNHNARTCKSEPRDPEIDVDVEEAA